MGICVNDTPQCSINTDDSRSCLIDTMTHPSLPQQHASLVITKNIPKAVTKRNHPKLYELYM